VLLEREEGDGEGAQDEAYDLDSGHFDGCLKVPIGILERGEIITRKYVLETEKISPCGAKKAEAPNHLHPLPESCAG
jgi:hypothetical protein